MFVSTSERARERFRVTSARPPLMMTPRVRSEPRYRLLQVSNSTQSSRRVNLPLTKSISDFLLIVC